MKKTFRRIVLAFALLLLVALSAGGLFAYAINQPKGNGAKKEIIVEQGASIRAIGDRLEQNGLVSSSTLFVLYIKLANLENQIQAGRYEIPPTLSITQIAELLRHGTFDVRLTFLEGWRREEYLAYALSSLPVDSQTFTKEFLSKTKDLEGSLFPDTYFVAQNITAAQLVKMLKSNFAKKYAQVADAVRAEGLTKKQAVILASIVEREASNQTDAKIIAGIFLKRLALGWPLDSDVTVQYAIGYQKGSGTWWKNDLTFADLNFESPYNTRRNQGLPPGAICSPGLVALGAVAYPTATTHLYFLYDKKGTIHYADTLQEHNANVAKYLR